MLGFLIGLKESQSQIFDENGQRIPVTSVEVNDCYLVDLKTSEKNNYISVKLGLKKVKNIKKPIKGELEKAGIKIPLRFLKEIRLEKFKDHLEIIKENDRLGIKFNDNNKIFIGDNIKSELMFKKGDKIKISGISKGKGFQGVVKRHKFAGGPRTHGRSHNERAPGSVGMTTTPGRIFKGKRMAGRMGGTRVTIRGLEIIEVKQNNLIIKGLIPGSKGSLVEIVKLN